MLSFSIILGLLSGGSALAEDLAPNASRGFQLAKRVAALENEKDLPSRAYWLSRRVIQNDRRVAFVRDEPEAQIEHREATIEN